MKKDILDKWLSICYKKQNKTIPIEYLSYLLQAMEEYALIKSGKSFALGIICGCTLYHLIHLVAN